MVVAVPTVSSSYGSGAGGGARVRSRIVAEEQGVADFFTEVRVSSAAFALAVAALVLWMWRLLEFSLGGEGRLGLGGERGSCLAGAVGPDSLQLKLLSDDEARSETEATDADACPNPDTDPGPEGTDAGPVRSGISKLDLNFVSSDKQIDSSSAARSAKQKIYR